MLIIKCNGEYSLGGRTSDEFVLPDYNSLDELYEHIAKKQPIKAKEPTVYRKLSIIEEESLRDRIVYLNNYLNIKESVRYVMSKEEIHSLNQKVCSSCKFNNPSLTNRLHCMYYYSEEGCHNYQESFSLIKWLKNKSNK